MMQHGPEFSKPETVVSSIVPGSMTAFAREISRTAIPVMAAAMSVFVSGCAGRPMMAHRPVEIDESLGGPRYLQGGEPIDTGSMRDELRKNPETTGTVDGAMVARATGILFAGAGGGMIGWPMGLAIEGDLHPPMAVFGAGCALLGAGIILSVFSTRGMDRAVETHNLQFARGRPSSLMFTRAPDPVLRLPPRATAKRDDEGP